MKKVTKSPGIPVGSDILTGFGETDYTDTYTITKQTDKSAEEISKKLIVLPDWAGALFWLRNKAVGIFGLKTDKNAGSEAFFTTISNRDEEIIMGENDKHLNFRASILKNRSENTISLITVVHFNNVWGKIYFLPVKPFHKIIMKALLKRYLAKQ